MKTSTLLKRFLPYFSRYKKTVVFDLCCAALTTVCELALPLVKPGGCFLAMKSVDSDDEIQSARGAMGQLGGKLESIRDYAIPGTEVTHRLVVIRKVKDTPPQFPRTWAKIKKAPLK